MKLLLPSILLAGLLFVAGCSNETNDVNVSGTSTGGPPLTVGNVMQSYQEKIDNILVTTIVSKNDNVLQAEYNAGLEQGRLQRTGILAARDNNWDNAYQTDPTHSFPTQEPPLPIELAEVQDYLQRNYAYTINYINTTPDKVVANNMKRILYRMIGIYHGARGIPASNLDMTGNRIPALSDFSADELRLGYGTPTLSFMDIYWIQCDEDALYLHYGPGSQQKRMKSKCSAFVKKTANDIFLAHNSWSGYLSQSMAQSLWVNDTFMTFNGITPGMVSSDTDFGYNKHGIIFNETTHLNDFDKPKVEALWMIWRATLAEQFATSCDEFYKYLSLEASGTYMNGYMVVDTKTREIGLVEMSWDTFVYFKSNATGGYDITTKPGGVDPSYDTGLIGDGFIFGVNMPVSLYIRNQLQSVDNRPERRVQFAAGIGEVQDVESAKRLITYTDPTNPLSIYGRWDLGYGITPRPKTIPEGSIEAKVTAASMVNYVFGLQGELDLNSPNKSFWMKWGTTRVDGKPFIWSQSQWSNQVLRDVPDVLDGSYQLLNLRIR